MSRTVTRTLLALALTLAAVNAASAAVELQTVVDPTTLPQCQTGHFFARLANTGTDPITVTFTMTLTHNGTVLFGPATAHAALTAGEARTREADFIVPSLLPTGDYVMTTQAVASDGSTANATAALTVTAGICGPITNTTPESITSLINVLGNAPQPNAMKTWGGLKVMYRD